jgi:hypothetical protein
VTCQGALLSYIPTKIFCNALTCGFVGWKNYLRGSLGGAPRPGGFARSGLRARPRASPRLIFSRSASREGRCTGARSRQSGSPQAALRGQNGARGTVAPSPSLSVATAAQRALVAEPGPGSAARSLRGR